MSSSRDTGSGWTSRAATSPRIDRNPNTGHPFGLDSEIKVAEQTVCHSAEYPSHVVLPVIPRD